MPHASAQRVILIGGPTASGKSALALRLAQTEKGCIINADALQVYVGLPLLTAQPSVADKASIPHYLYETIDPSEASSAGKWLAQARAVLAKAKEFGHTPILVGGTGMYFAALLGGLAEIPAIPDTVRREAEERYATLGEEKFRAELASRDSTGAAKIERNDRQRLVRAWVVATHTGKPLSVWQQEGAAQAGVLQPEFHLLMPPREKLYGICDARFLSMMDKGAGAEVETLLASGLSLALPAMKIIGVREIASYLNGEISLGDAVARAQQMTRNYAKRQMTWFGNQWEKELRKKTSGSIIHKWTH
jgi:tRNA dimethylallyltransferase